MSTWPITLPQLPLLSGYKMAPIDPVIRTEMEGSNTRSRRRATARNDKVSVTWKMNGQQYYIFRLWYDDVTGANGGASWFYIPLKTGSDSTGAPQTVEAIFASMWTADYGGPNEWTISATLEVRYA